MIKYIFQRIVAAIITFFVIMVVVFFVLNAMPGSVYSVVMSEENVKRLKQETIDLMMSKYHFDKPLIVQFYYMVTNYLKLDFGVSLVMRQKTPVFDIIKERLPVTIQLNYFSAFVILPFGMFFGITMALRKDTVYDHIASSLVILFIAVPSFVMAALMQYFLAFRLGWFPIILEAEETLTWAKFYSMLLPIFALSFGPIAHMSRTLRAELSEVLTSDFMLLAKAKGLTYGQTIWRHALRNACVPLATTFLFLFIGVLGSSIVIENIFSVPGLSRIMYQGINLKDHQLTLAVIYFYVLIGLFMGIIADLSYGVVDPRIRMGGKKDE